MGLLGLGQIARGNNPEGQIAPDTSVRHVAEGARCVAGRAGPQRPKSKGRGRRARHVPPKGGRNDPNFSLPGRLFSSSLSVQLSKNFSFALIIMRMVLVHFIYLMIMNFTKPLLVGSFHSYNTSRHHFEISGHAPYRRCLHPVPHFGAR